MLGISARRPKTVTSCTPLSGSTLPSFFSSTMLFCAASRVSLRWGFATDHVRRVVARMAALPELHQLPQDPQRSVVRDRFGDLAFLDQVGQEAVVHVREGHLDVLTGERRLLRITDREDPVGLHEALKAPLLLQDVGQQRLVLARPFAVQAV